MQLSKEIDDFDRNTKAFDRASSLAEVKGKHMAENNKRAAEVRVKVAEYMLNMVGQ